MRDDANGEQDRLAAALSLALERGELHAVFQPQLDLRTDRLVGAEALCRWTSADVGAIPPTTFIPVAETSGVIDPLGRFMIDRAADAVDLWTRSGRAIEVSVNVSPVQLASVWFPDWLTGRVSRARSFARRLTLEITESRAIDDVAAVLRRLAPLRLLGVGIALDDFGAGHSSLTQLKRLHGSEVKLDKSLVQDLSDPATERIALLVRHAHASGVRVVAEGVETQEHLERARELGCDRGQGHLIGHPMSAEEIAALPA